MGGKRLWAIIGVIISVTLGWLQGNLDWEAVQEVAYRMHIPPWVPIAIFSYLAGHVVRGLCCKLLISRSSEISLVTSANVVVSGYAVNNVLRARLGELVRVALLSDVSGLPVSQSLTVVFVERVLDGIILMLLSSAACWTLAVELASGYTLALLAVVFGSCFGAIIIAVTSTCGTRSVWSKIFLSEAGSLKVHVGIS